MKSEVLQKAQRGWIGKETPSGLTKSARMPLPGLWVAVSRQPSQLAAVLYANGVLEKAFYVRFLFPIFGLSCGFT